VVNDDLILSQKAKTKEIMSGICPCLTTEYAELFMQSATEGFHWADRKIASITL